MPLFKNPFQSGKADEELTSLNLETPTPQSPPDNPVASVPQIDPRLLAIAGPEVTRRTKVILQAGIRPQALYLIVEKAGNIIFTFRLKQPEMTILLIFTSGFAAMDYIRTTKIDGGVHMFPFESLPTYLEMWRKMPMDHFVFNRCPRCPHGHAFKMEGITEQQFLFLWAADRATRSFQAERSIRSYFDTSTAPKNAQGTTSHRRAKREFLEFLRDHIDCSVPYVHWLIAIDAGVDGDEEVRSAAIQALEAFGPDFKDKVPPPPLTKPHFEDWTKSVTEARNGLLAAYGLLLPDLQSAIKNEEKIVNLPSPPTT